jgi:hypothetical protein
MTNDARFLSRERFVRMKDATSIAPKANGRGKHALAGEARRHVKLLEATRMRIVRQKDTVSTEEDKKGQKATLRAELDRTAAPAGFAMTGAGLLVPLAVALELALAAACGGIVADDEDVDADVNTDAETAEVDAEDDTPTEDAEQPDEVAPEVEADAEDEGMDEATDAPDAVEDGDAETDTPVCEPSVYNETRAPEPSGSLCGISKQKIVTIQVTEYPAECGIPRSTSLESVLFRVLGVLPADLTCARGEETEGLNPGIHLVVSLTPTELQMGLKLASALGTHPSSTEPTLMGGMYGIAPREINGAYVRCDLHDAVGTLLRSINAWDTNTSAIDFDNAAMSWAIDFPYASIGLVRTPLFIATHGGTVYYEGLGDEGDFTVRMRIDGVGADESWGFYRVHAK